MFSACAAIPSTLIIPPPLPSALAVLVVIVSPLTITSFPVPFPTVTAVVPLLVVLALLFPLANIPPSFPVVSALRVTLFFPLIFISALDVLTPVYVSSSIFTLTSPLFTAAASL